MKTSLKVAAPGVLAIGLCLLFAFGPPNEEDAIKAVIEKETTSFFSGDLAAWATCFKQDDQTVTCGASVSGPTVNQGWDVIRKDGEAMHKSITEPMRFLVERDNWHIQQSGNVAFATYDQKITVGGWPGTALTKEIRCLEKVNGGWKIVALSWMEKIKLDTDAHREAIKAVIAAETQGYFDQDFEAWAAQWVRDEGVSMAANNEDGSVTQIVGFDKMAAAVKEGMKGEKTKFSVRRENWDIKMNGSCAVVRFDQHFTDNKNKTWDSREFRVMVWDGAQWKIAQVNAFWDYKNAK